MGLENERFLDYNNWFVCYDCGQEHIPYEDENFNPSKDPMLCSNCKDEHPEIEVK